MIPTREIAPWAITEEAKVIHYTYYNVLYKTYPCDLKVNSGHTSRCTNYRDRTHRSNTIFRNG